MSVIKQANSYNQLSTIISQEATSVIKGDKTKHKRSASMKLQKNLFTRILSNELQNLAEIPCVSRNNR